MHYSQLTRNEDGYVDTRLGASSSSEEEEEESICGIKRAANISMAAGISRVRERAGYTVDSFFRRGSSKTNFAESENQADDPVVHPCCDP